MHVLFATAEFEPVVATGGLGAASAGLVAALRRHGIRVTPVIPGFAPYELEGEGRVELDVAPWAGSVTVRTGHHAQVGPIAVVDAPGLARPHPYTDPATGGAWPDNDRRFFTFAAAVAALSRHLGPDVVHLHDWHAAAALAFTATGGPPTMLSIHNLAHQGWADPEWIDVMGPRGEAFRQLNSVNCLAGAIRLADAVVTVSPRYAYEITTPEGGHGLDRLLSEHRGKLWGILNGIDADEWNPSIDEHLHTPYDAGGFGAKVHNQEALCAELGLATAPGPLIVAVSRLDYQKGLDLLAEVAWMLTRIPARIAVLGSGEPDHEAAWRYIAAHGDGRIAFTRGYDLGLAHRMFAAGDLAVIPSRFEPCGLTQMQAMRYGTLPIVSDVGGLHDTVVDVDADPVHGTGVRMHQVSPAGIVDGVHRGVRLVGSAAAAAARHRAMTHDWSWDTAAKGYLDRYAALVPG
ncbi:MAG: glycogen/starch synthase [Microthrixaceae bacterium]